MVSISTLALIALPTMAFAEQDDVLDHDLDMGTAALACFIDANDDVFLVFSDGLVMAEEDMLGRKAGNEAARTFEVAPMVVQIDAILDDLQVVPPDCADAGGVYLTQGEGVTLLFEDWTAATYFSDGSSVTLDDAEAMMQTQAPFYLYVSPYDHQVVDGAELIGTQAPFYL